MSDSVIKKNDHRHKSVYQAVILLLNKVTSNVLLGVCLLSMIMIYFESLLLTTVIVGFFNLE